VNRQRATVMMDMALAIGSCFNSEAGSTMKQLVEKLRGMTDEELANDPD
jgi:hypothetical protein